MKRIIFSSITATVALASVAIVPASAIAVSSTAATSAKSAASSAQLTLIIQRGDTEISRRLTSLGTLGSKISSATKLSSSDQLSLSNEVSTEITGLTALKSKLDADTDVATARTDAQSIFNDYRVYALILPKVYLVKTADDQQAAEDKLTALIPQLQTRLTADQQAGKNVSSELTALSDLTSKTAAAQTISAGIESKVVTLQPSDYDSDHTVLSGDAAQLKTAATDLKAALADAQSIVTGLKTLDS